MSMGSRLGHSKGPRCGIHLNQHAPNRVGWRFNSRCEAKTESLFSDWVGVGGDLFLEPL
jgi:hypothetical protein